MKPEDVPVEVRAAAEAAFMKSDDRAPWSGAMAAALAAAWPLIAKAERAKALQRVNELLNTWAGKKKHDRVDAAQIISVAIRALEDTP